MEDVVQRLKSRQSTYDNAYDNSYYCNGRYYSNYDDCYSNWYSWGRWIFIAGIIIAFLILFSLCACITHRRRRRGLQPYYGTAWMPFRPTNPNPNPNPNGTQFTQYPYDPNNPQYTQYYTPPTAPAPPYTPSPNMPPTSSSPFVPQQPYYPPPPGSPPGVAQHSTGATRESDYYSMPPPGPPPQAHVGKM
ncbi:chitin synthesis regulation, resistance to congo red-domain-containing protein [Morchella snyderi]|nr:chitin synthesis regulation, resistance to congo red-domain-containing protein [Morchella snyderi]